jgi:DNA polymerase-3 subunit chi
LSPIDSNIDASGKNGFRINWNHAARAARHSPLQNRTTAMTRIDFHTNVPDKIAYACRLVRKAYAANHRVVLMAEDEAQLTELNAAMWAFSATDFLPHVLAGDPLAPHTPIVLADNDEAELPHTELLVNLSRRSSARVAEFERMIEVISSDEDDAAAGRKRYVAYKQQDYPLTHFVTGKS